MLIFPPNQNCPLCSQQLPQGRLVCGSCDTKLKLWQEEAKCKTCGRLIAGDEGRCFSCKENPPAFKIARAAAPYDGDFGQAVKRLKYQGEQWLAEPLGIIMGELIEREALYKGIDLLIPVPLSKRRLAERGFNQSFLLAKAIGKYLDLPHSKDVLFKIQETQDQIGLKRVERLLNLKGVFAVKESTAIKGKSILLVDDILTTGSTAHHGSQVLLDEGAAEVRVITWAGVIG